MNRIKLLSITAASVLIFAFIFLIGIYSFQTVLLAAVVLVLSIIAAKLISMGKNVVSSGHDGISVIRLQDYLSNIINSMPSMIIGVDLNLSVTQWNRTASEKTGIGTESAMGKPLIELVPGLAPHHEIIRDSINTGEVRYEKGSASVIKAEDSFEDITIYPLKANESCGAVIRIDDVTGMVKMHEMIAQSEKMLSVGGLAAGMAHEINNPLAGMMQSAEVIYERLSNVDMPANIAAADKAGLSLPSIKAFMDDREILSMLQGIKTSGVRAAEIVDNMLSFARKNDNAKSTHDIAVLLDRAVYLASTDYELKKKYDFKAVAIKREFQADLPPVPCSEQKIQQVFLNIIKNGVEAMNVYKTEQVRSGSDYKPEFTLRIKQSDAGMIKVEIQDNGPGMTENVRKRAVEPFFTTKSPGESTGLGLLVSFFIITQNHNGTFEIESHEGAGANFIIQLPYSN